MLRLFKHAFVIALVFYLNGCSTISNIYGPDYPDGRAPFYSVKEPIQCVEYARGVSGIPIRGDAHTWWNQASNKGSDPRVGAVLVLSKTSKLRYGHLAVVKKILSPRVIEVTHSNWGNDRDSRKIIYERMRVEDLSPNNDWSSVRFWNYDINGYGFPYKASGFVYP